MLLKHEKNCFVKLRHYAYYLKMRPIKNRNISVPCLWI